MASYGATLSAIPVSSIIALMPQPKRFELLRTIRSALWHRVLSEVTAIHDTKVREQLRDKLRDQADRDFLEVSHAQTNLYAPRLC